MVEGGLIEIEAREAVEVRAVCAWGRRTVTAHARREVIGVLRGLVEAVGVVASMRGLQEGVVRDVVALGRHDGQLLVFLRLEGGVVAVAVLSQGVVRLVLEVLREAGVGEVRRGCSVVQTLEGVGGQ